MAARVLIVEDEIKFRHLLQAGLSGHGYEVETAADGLEALEKAVNWSPDVIVLDLGLPKLGGLEVCQSIRSWSLVPIIVLSVRDTERDKILALDMGADDYLTKPFNMGELRARIRVALRHAARATGTTDTILAFDHLRLDLVRRRVFLGDREVHLTPTEFDLLRLLATHAGQVLTHTQLMREAWGDQAHQDTRILRVFIGQLRRKLDDNPTNPRFILTESGVGYRFRESAD